MAIVIVRVSTVGVTYHAQKTLSEEELNCSLHSHNGVHHCGHECQGRSSCRDRGGTLLTDLFPKAFSVGRSSRPASSSQMTTLRLILIVKCLANGSGLLLTSSYIVLNRYSLFTLCYMAVLLITWHVHPAAFASS